MIRSADAPEVSRRGTRVAEHHTEHDAVARERKRAAADASQNESIE
jgi:hypothetical protein